MASAPGSSSRPHGPLKGDWASCSISRLRLNRLAVQGYLPASDLASTRPGLTSSDGQALAENHPTPHGEERVCFVPFLLRGLGFPIHPFLRGLLEFYGIQLHHLTPNSILHISGFVALCEMFLGCEAHFGLWQKYFCLVPRSREGVIYEVGGAEVCRIAGTGYLPGTPKEDTENWTSEWFYMADVPLYDPARRGLPEFSHIPPKKRFNWRPRSPSQEKDAEVKRLAAQVSCLAHNKLTTIDVIAMTILRGVQPLQQRVHPLWRYNGKDDATRSVKEDFASPAALAAVLAGIFKGEEEDFARRKFMDGFSYYKPVEAVSIFNYVHLVYPSSVLILLNSCSTYPSRGGGAGWRR